MKQTLMGIVALVVGFFTLSFTLFVAMVAGVAAMIAAPFIKRKIVKTQQDMQQQANARVFEGEYQDITRS